LDRRVAARVGRGISHRRATAVKDFLEDGLGRTVDVETREGLDPVIRDRVIREARALF
jgi:predicted nucleotidyltransferase